MNKFKYKMQNFFYNLAGKTQRFMSGRYGVDQLYRFGMYFTMILLILQLFLRNSYLYIVTLTLMILNGLRPFSKKYSQRAKENQIYLNISGKIKSYINLQVKKFKDRKEYRYRKCPNCKKILRLKNKKGQHTVCCPNCHQDFNVRI
ncbi:MAG: hypothetical protein Q4C64_00600 [Erysipelotrichia bacterium]|nr:hypothetical protein [Erysipelotrichia bacterium]